MRNCYVIMLKSHETGQTEVRGKYMCKEHAEAVIQKLAESGIIAEQE